MSSSFESGRLCVALVSTRNPLNIGAAARAMSNFGVSRLRVVNPYEPSFREAKSAVGAAEVLANAEEYKSVAEAVSDCTLVVGTTASGRRDLQHPLLLLHEGASAIHKHLGSNATSAGGRVALLFGSEKRGLSNEEISHCHWLMRIPTREAHSSMNLGQAVAVCLYELARGSKTVPETTTEIEKKPNVPAAQPSETTAASSGDVERITAVLLEALRASGYLNPRAKAPTEEKIRRLVRRLNLSEPDAETWLGMLRQILWKLKTNLAADQRR